MRKASIAIQNKQLAIFGLNLGYLGEVIQDYKPFENEAEAIAAAKAKLKEMGRECEDEISRPFISSIRITRCKARRKRGDSR